MCGEVGTLHQQEGKVVQLVVVLHYLTDEERLVPKEIGPSNHDCVPLVRHCVMSGVHFDGQEKKEESNDKEDKDGGERGTEATLWTANCWASLRVGLSQSHCVH